MNLLDFFKVVKTMETIQISYNKSYTDSATRYIEVKEVRTGLYGRLLEPYCLSEIHEREIHCISAQDSRICIFLGEVDS